MNGDERYEDCDRCGERFYGGSIKAFTREIEVVGGPVHRCLSCLEADRKDHKTKESKP